MYEQLRRLGSGHFGEVWLERDLALDRLCAAKYLNGPGSHEMLDPFAEARSMLTSEHDHVVKVYSAQVEAGIAVIRMEYLANGSVSDRYGAGPLPVGRALAIVEDACRGVECLHARDLLHRDLKPANLMLAPTDLVKVSDFGLACKIAEASSAPIGYLPHLPPEALPQPGFVESALGDVYALGVTLYRLLVGDTFMDVLGSRSWAQVEADIQTGQWPPRDAFGQHVHAGLRRVVKKAMHVDPGKRFQSAAEMRHALERVRPRVSWQPSDAQHGWAWEGATVDGSALWRARQETTGGERVRFSLKRRLTGSTFRAVNVGSAEFADAREASSHAARVLQQIAVEGRL